MAVMGTLPNFRIGRRASPALANHCKRLLSTWKPGNFTLKEKDSLLSALGTLQRLLFNSPSTAKPSIGTTM
jgi:hypothetical protein